MSISLFPLLEKSTEYVPISSSHNEHMMNKAQQHLYEITRNYNLNMADVNAIVIQPLMQALFHSEQVDYSLISCLIDETQNESFIEAKKELIEQVKVLEYVSNKMMYTDTHNVWSMELFSLQPVSI
jgi:hypothetical protein